MSEHMLSQEELDALLGFDADPADAPSAAKEGSAGPTAAERVADVPLQLTVQLAAKRMSVGETAGLQRGSLIHLEESVSDPVKVFANGVFIANAEVVVVGERLALKVVRIASAADDGRDG